MNGLILIVLGILVLTIVVVTLFLKKSEQKKNYLVFFIFGMTWLPLGIVLRNIVFGVLGAIFLTIGLVNVKKWSNAPKWSELPPEVRKVKLIIIFLLGVVALAGLMMYFLAFRGNLLLFSGGK